MTNYNTNNYTYIKCEKCKGRGRVTDHMLGVCGFGLGYLAQKLDSGFKQYCPECDGKGEVKKRIYSE
jgi:Archaea-specific RecJ-like exonuclease, contains DnaJ-type Zn finger domain